MSERHEKSWLVLRLLIPSLSHHVRKTREVLVGVTIINPLFVPPCQKDTRSLGWCYDYQSPLCPTMLERHEKSWLVLRLSIPSLSHHVRKTREVLVGVKIINPLFVHPMSERHEKSWLVLRLLIPSLSYQVRKTREVLVGVKIINSLFVHPMSERHEKSWLVLRLLIPSLSIPCQKDTRSLGWCWPMNSRNGWFSMSMYASLSMSLCFCLYVSLSLSLPFCPSSLCLSLSVSLSHGIKPTHCVADRKAHRRTLSGPQGQRG